MTRYEALRPFLPSQNFEQSCAFYDTLSFERTWKDDSVAVYSGECYGFLVQNFYVEQWASNAMVQLVVHELDRWWAEHVTPELIERFGLRVARPPAMQPWGLRVGFLSDPAGVLWHMTEATAD